jgi:hypothetical protein
MHSDNLAQNLFSYARLGVGCCAFVGGAYHAWYQPWHQAVVGRAPGASAEQVAQIAQLVPEWGGVIIAGIGLALALHETAYIGARFLASFLKPPPSGQ